MADRRLNVLRENDVQQAIDTDKWGYVVCVGNIITFIAGIGHVNSFGLIYNDFMIETNSTTKSLTTAHGVFAVMLAIGGIILNLIGKKYSLKLGGILGAVIFSVGSFLTIFINNTNQLSYTFGLLQGLGFGMMVPVSYSSLNYYFVRKRTTVMSICKAIQGIILMLYPQFVEKCMKSYGRRGTLLILSGISLHGIVGMLIMKLKKETTHEVIKTAKDAEACIEITENDDLIKQSDNKLLHEKHCEGESTPKKHKLTRKFNLLELLNVKVLRDSVYCNICLGQSFVNFSDLTFFVLQPMLLFQYGFDHRDVAYCISIGAGADVIGRFTLALLSHFVHINTRLLFFMTTFITLICRVVLLQVTQFAAVSAVTALLGVLRAWVHLTSPLVISNHVTHADFPGAYAVFLLAAGLVNFTFAPLIGLLKDMYQDYVPAFYALSWCCVPCLLFWPLEYILTRK